MVLAKASSLAGAIFAGCVRRADRLALRGARPGPPPTTDPAAGGRGLLGVAGAGRPPRSGWSGPAGCRSARRTSATPTTGRTARVDAERGGYARPGARVPCLRPVSNGRPGPPASDPAAVTWGGPRHGVRRAPVQPSSGVPAAVLENVFDDPTHGEPGRDRVAVHVTWELVLLAGLAVLTWLLLAGRPGRAARRRPAGLLVDVVAAGAARPGRRPEPADGGGEPGGRPGRGRRRAALRRAGRPGGRGRGGPRRGRWPPSADCWWRWPWSCCTCRAGRRAWPVRPAWWSTSSGGPRRSSCRAGTTPATARLPLRRLRRAWRCSAACSARSVRCAGWSGGSGRSADPARRRGGGGRCRRRGRARPVHGARHAGRRPDRRATAPGRSSPTAGLDWTVLAIGIALLGGTSAYGRRGGIFGTLLAVEPDHRLPGLVRGRAGWQVSRWTVGGAALGVGLVVTRLVEAYGRPRSVGADAETRPSGDGAISSGWSVPRPAPLEDWPPALPTRSDDSPRTPGRVPLGHPPRAGTAATADTPPVHRRRTSRSHGGRRRTAVRVGGRTAARWPPADGPRRVRRAAGDLGG